MVAWILLLCIAFECLIEGIAFALTLSDELGAGIAILAAMIIKLIPQKLGDAVILRFLLFSATKRKIKYVFLAKRD